MNISSIVIGGLFGKHDVRLTIKDNALILVGANGLGKSTILSIIHSTIARHWDVLQGLPFKYIMITINGRELRLDADSLRSSAIFAIGHSNELSSQTWASPRRRAAAQSLASLNFRLLQAIGGARTSDEFVEAYSLHAGDTEFDDAFNAWTFLSAPQNRQAVQELYDDGPIKRALEVLSDLDSYRIMYLPTYRRIEKTLQDLFPDINEAIQRHQRNRSATKVKSPLVEFIQFGMGDVLELYSDTLTRLRSHSNRVLSATSGSYLRDIIRGQGSEYDEDRIRSLDSEIVTGILRRYEGGEFAQRDVLELLKVTATVRAKGKLSSNQKLMAHYLIRLIEAMDNISSVERPVRALVDITANYFHDKAMVYSDVDGTLTIREAESGNVVDLKDLSSGEKQIVSLLSHVYLEEKETLLFIDEPELSLSVDWQLRLLPDLRKSGRCAFLLAVTHSPFIFDNELEKHTVDVRSTLGGGR